MSDALIQEKFCNAGGTRVHYLERQGTEKSNTLLLLHSFASGAFIWREWMSSIRFNGRILAPDLPGNGSSSLPAEKPVLSYHARFLKEFCDANEVQRFIGCGISMGSNILAAFALNSPEMITHLVLTNPIDDKKPLNRLWKIAARPGVGEIITKFFPGSLKTLQKQISKNFYNAETLKPELISEWWKSFESGYVRRWIPKALRAPNAPIDWQGLQVPCTVVFGKNDPVVSVSFRLRLQSTMKTAAFIELDHCGHYPHLEYPQEMEDLILTVCNASLQSPPEF